MDRYIRNIQLKGIGEAGQRKLLSSSVFIVGSGALGSIVAMYLAGSGVGRIGVADFDDIDMTNLQRQLAFTESDIHRHKASTLAGKLREINSEIEIEAFEEKLDTERATELFGRYDVIVEATDRPESKYMVTDVCAALGKPVVFGGVAQTRGQVMTIPDASGVQYRDIFPEGASEGEYLPASKGGILGPVPGVVGSLQAAEVIKLLTGLGTVLRNSLLAFDLSDMSFRKIEL